MWDTFLQKARGLRYRFWPETAEQGVLFVVLWLFLGLIIVLPIGVTLYYSFAPSFPLTGDYVFTIEHYVELFNEHDVLAITKNTFIYATGATVVAMVLGIGLAIIVEKIFPSAKLSLAILLPYAIPSIAALAGWIILLGNNGVITNLIIDTLNLSDRPFSIYTIWGMIWVEGLHTAPVAFLFLRPAIKAIPKEMEEASWISGGSRLRTVRKIVLPIVWPSILSTSIFLFARAMATVATPSVLGLREQIYTFGSAIPFLFLSGTSLNYSIALAFSILLTIVSTIMIMFYMRITRKTERFTTIAGTGTAATGRYDVSATARYGFYALIGAFVFLAGLLPFLAIVWDSVQQTIQLSFAVNDFTLRNYSDLFAGELRGVANVRRAVKNTIIVGLVVPTTTMIFAFVISYVYQNTNLPTGKYLSLGASATLAVPSISKGLGFLVALIRTPLYGTLGILIIAFHSFTLPIAMRYTSPAITRIGVANFEASLLDGAGVLRTIKRIALPLVSDDFIAGWMHLYVSVIRNIPIAILLYATGSEVLAVELLLTLQAGFIKTASTLAVLITVMSIGPYIGLQYLRLNRTSN